MPLAPALKGLLLASSLIAAGVAAYETDPNVRQFVDRTTKRAEDALVDFLENLEREFSPDGVGRGQIRRRREREREMMRMGREGERHMERSERDRERETGRGGDVVTVVSGGELRQRRQRIEVVDMDAQNEAPETLFEQFPASLNGSTIHNIHIDDVVTATPNLHHKNNNNNNNTSLLDANNDDDYEEDVSSASLDNLSDLDPFADPPIESLTPLVLSTAHLSPGSSHHEQSELTPTSSNSPQMLTPVTLRTVAEDEVSDSYFSDFSAGSMVPGDEGEGGERIMVGRRGSDRSRSLSVASSGVGFETPDEDDEDDIHWGRA